MYDFYTNPNNPCTQETTKRNLWSIPQTLIQDSCYLLIRLDTVLAVKNAKAHAAGSGEMFFIATVEADESTPQQ